jgi:hypothetical protein
MSLQLKFTPWRPFHAVKDSANINSWVKHSAQITHGYFRSKMESSRGGRLYTHELRTINGRIVQMGPLGAPHRASAPGDFPARRSGRLIRSIRQAIDANGFEIGTNEHYALYLFKGTSRMKKRKMSKEALLESKSRWGHIGRLAVFRHSGANR